MAVNDFFLGVVSVLDSHEHSAVKLLFAALYGEDKMLEKGNAIICFSEPFQSISVATITAILSNELSSANSDSMKTHWVLHNAVHIATFILCGCKIQQNLNGRLAAAWVMRVQYHVMC